MEKQKYRKRCEKKIQRYKNSKEYQQLKERFEKDKMFEQQIRTWEFVVNGLKESESKPKVLMTTEEIMKLNTQDQIFYRRKQIDGNGLCEVRDSNERWKGLLQQQKNIEVLGHVKEKQMSIIVYEFANEEID